MIGQERLRESVNELIIAGKFPQCAIIQGDVGSGRRTLLNDVLEVIWAKDVSINSVREVIDMTYQGHGWTFGFADIDNMSTAAQNALLKVLEESPNDNRFVLTCVDIRNVLPTIQSRAVMFSMEPYKPSDIAEYAKQFTEQDDVQIYVQCCDTPGDVQLLAKSNAHEFKGFVDKVVEHIGTVSVANVFKISQKVALKPDVDGYDLAMFWKLVVRRCLELAVNDGEKEYLKVAVVTSACIRDLHLRGINREMLFSTWLLDVQEVL